MALKRIKTSILIVWILIGLSLIPTTECLIKMFFKKKFMEGFILGMLLGKEFYSRNNPQIPY
jgi:hypothetical protein